MVLLRLLLAQKERDGEKVEHGADFVGPLSTLQRSEDEDREDDHGEELEVELGFLLSRFHHLHICHRDGFLFLLGRRIFCLSRDGRGEALKIISFAFFFLKAIFFARQKLASKEKENS